ncbi:hypothetical protein ARMGADRAFT_1112654 [Armillaria gallica]|uniref:Uncharacterized protein n=1 Tax=Armillaria gallica TaxID=47427 RepID=A0A2H3D937_ARMGA|nr:hypothetical protein ARMGADRAFT_1112654 [Armillaria gallica]
MSPDPNSKARFSRVCLVQGDTSAWWATCVWTRSRTRESRESGSIKSCSEVRSFHLQVALSYHPSLSSQKHSPHERQNHHVRFNSPCIMTLPFSHLPTASPAQPRFREIHCCCVENSRKYRLLHSRRRVGGLCIYGPCGGTGRGVRLVDAAREIGMGESLCREKVSSTFAELEREARKRLGLVV